MCDSVRQKLGHTKSLQGMEYKTACNYYKIVVARHCAQRPVVHRGLLKSFTMGFDKSFFLL